MLASIRSLVPLRNTLWITLTAAFAAACEPVSSAPDSATSMTDASDVQAIHGSDSAVDSASVTEPPDANEPADATTNADVTASAPQRATLLRVGFYNQHMTVGRDQRLHLTFLDGAAERMHYATCERDCGTERGWTVTQLLDVARLGTTTVGPYGIASDASGRLHLIASAVPRVGQSAYSLMYGSCATACTTASNWTFVDLSALAPGRSLIGTNDTLMVHPSGSVSFLTAGTFDATRPAYLRCDANCTVAAQWRAVAPPTINGNPLRAALDSAGVSHVLYSSGRTAAGDRLLQYARCASNCGEASSWQASMLGFLYSTNDWEAGFAIDAADRLFITYNQGTTSQGVEVNRRYLVNSCAGAGCLALDTWSSVAVGTPDEGVGGAWIARRGAGLAMTTVSDFEVRVRTCDRDCATAASWSASSVLDDNAAISATINADTGTSCPGRSESAAWWPRMPVLALNDRGWAVVHNPSGLVRCPGTSSPTRVPNIARVLASF